MASRKRPLAASRAAPVAAANPAFGAVPLAEPAAAFEPETTLEPTSAFEPAPSFEAAPVTDEAPLVEYAPVVEPAPVFEPAPSFEAAPVMDEAPLVEYAPVVEPAPVFEPAPSFEAAPVTDEAPLEEYVPVVEPAPVSEPAHVKEAAPVMEDTPYTEYAPATESVPVPPLKAEVEVPAPFAHVAKIMEAPMASMTEAQGKVRSMVETGLTETHSRLSQMKSAADEAAHAFETSYATIKNGAVQINVKALEALTATAEANFAFFKSVFAVKSPSDYVMLHSEFARKQIEMMTAHTKAFGELAQKVATETVEPIKAQVAKTFHIQ